MGYRRVKHALTEYEICQIAKQFETAIKALVNWFREHPYACYTETDIHCYLYHRLYKGGLINGIYPTAGGHETILLPKEYPTDGRYSRCIDGTLKPDPTGRRRGAFDISIWDPAYIRERGHRKQKVLCAAELALNECGRGNVHTKNDAMKLADTRNGVKHPYLLFFVRDDSNFARNEERIRANLDEAKEKMVRVALAIHDCKKKHKPSPVYLGQWLTNGLS